MKNTDEDSYKSLLWSEEWRKKRDRILQRDNNKCVICGASDNLVVHHRQYHFNLKKGRKEDPWNYEDKYLITLCEECHKEGHKKYQIPIKQIYK